IKVLLAEDDIDDRYFFEKVLKSLTVHTELAIVEDGAKLMSYLAENSEKLPDILFLDLNMPRKNGTECLSEIKQNERLKHLPVIIFSTHKHGKDSDILYEKGAHYYIRKTDMIELAKALHHILTLMVENKFERPVKEKFSLTVDTLKLS
ncbi:MAG TPA: response regulator, partial [Chitinophagaceae bacterium]|nr:response regulator [Chitinophagaceae bacterium]